MNETCVRVRRLSPFALSFMTTYIHSITRTHVSPSHRTQLSSNIRANPCLPRVQRSTRAASPVPSAWPQASTHAYRLGLNLYRHASTLVPSPAIAGRGASGALRLGSFHTAPVFAGGWPRLELGLGSMPPRRGVMPVAPPT